jgi:hypothetical protein
MAAKEALDQERDAAILAGIEQTKKLAQEDFARFVADMGKVDALRRRKEVIQAEMDELQKELRHKKLCLATLGPGFRTLHPGMEQSISKLETMKDIKYYRYHNI